jgi:glycosyltransferase involved in cell wall biosynthesis
MKICIISLNLAAYFDTSPRSRYGGAEVQAAFVASALAAAGQEVALVVADLLPDIAIPYPTVSAFGARGGLPGLRFFHPRMSGIFDALDGVDADVYYQRNAGMVTGLTAHFCRRRGKVFVYGAGSDTDFSFRRVLIEGLRDRVLFQYGLRHADGVVVQSESQLGMSRGIVAAPVRMIPNGALPATLPLTGRDGAIVWAGGIRAVKRPELFIELARRIPEREFVVVGGGLPSERDYAAAVERTATGIPNLTFTGWLPHPEVIRHIARASLVVNTSMVEGFPNVYLEAWNHGVPVISFNDVDGIIERERLGVLCADIGQMETSIRSLLADNDRLRAMQEGARRVVEERFSPSVLGPRYVEFFEQLKRKRAGGN